MTRSSSFQILLFILIFAVGGAGALALYGVATPAIGHAAILGGAFIAAWIAAAAFKIAAPWDRAVVLRLVVAQRGDDDRAARAVEARTRVDGAVTDWRPR